MVWCGGNEGVGSFMVMPECYLLCIPTGDVERQSTKPTSTIILSSPLMPELGLRRKRSGKSSRPFHQRNQIWPLNAWSSLGSGGNGDTAIKTVLGCRKVSLGFIPYIPHPSLTLPSTRHHKRVPSSPPHLLKETSVSERPP